MNFSVPATSANLGPGFDSLGLSLSYRNYFSIVESSKEHINVNGEGMNNPHFTQDNTFVKIFMQTYKALGGDSQFSFTFQNNIPVSRGMGSSSAVIVGAIFAAYKMAKLIPNKDEVLNLALKYEKHPDNITPATFGGFNASMISQKFIESKDSKQDSIKKDSIKNPKLIKSDVVTYIRKSIPKVVKSVMVIPNKPMNTKKSRTILPKTYSTKDCVFNISHSCMLSLAFILQKWELLRESSLDKMHENARMETYPVLFSVQKLALNNGALMSTLSGSGSSIFSLCYSEDSKRLAKKMAESFPRFRILTLDFDNDGVKIEKD
ncbi:homoserine kinase [Helicobacter saguini]|uniref:Homoserine kinase n=1 Tax=Helicobacter saguini TaxID=1548018 RepID=A0A347VUM0_9HELI|nr:homoserine kinase [Helicobacter saguini]MWV62779.1 homoserine kinase [Helicobacter saguini]MWV66551.1 homoserine kinase [Helicobacter saguini]MWV68901.1 homoserine kinase [Helicobacter saguini]MWV71545.1 homoserine kinase [Helicobacter saguini]TLD93640.1 homoserine kinase [Helicobacter saguini]